MTAKKSGSIIISTIVNRIEYYKWNITNNSHIHSHSLIIIDRLIESLIVFLSNFANKTIFNFIIVL